MDTEQQQNSLQEEKRAELEARHRKEKKELQAKLTAMKKTATKGDKKKKKEVQAEASLLESELTARHEREALDFGRVQGTSKEQNEETEEPTTPSSVPVAEEAESLTGEDERSGTLSEARTIPGKKPNRQKLRKERKAAELDALRKEAEQETVGMVDKAKLEKEALEELTSVMRLKIREIIPDGHCLYNAFADQLRTYFNSTKTFKDLRHQAAEHLRTHPDDFLPFLVNSNGDMQSPEEFTQYCNNVENTAAWGGQPEILALSQVNKVPVHVVQVGSPVIRVGEEYPADRPVKLSYHRHMYGLGEHYNSLYDAE